MAINQPASLLTLPLSKIENFPGLFPLPSVSFAVHPASSYISITAFAPGDRARRSRGCRVRPEKNALLARVRRARKCRQCRNSIQIKSAFFLDNAALSSSPLGRSTPRQYHDSTTISCRFIPTAATVVLTSRGLPFRVARLRAGGEGNRRRRRLCADMTDRRAFVRRGSFLLFLASTRAPVRRASLRLLGELRGPVIY